MLALAPIIRTVPMMITRTTANIMAYSATSCPSVSRQNLSRSERMMRLLDPDFVKCCKRRKWLKGGVRAGRHTAQDLTDSLFIAEHLVGTGVSNQENEAIRAHWMLTLDSSRLLDQCLHQAAGRWRKVKTVAFELLIMPLEQSGIPRTLAREEHPLECILELVCFAVAAAIFQRQVYPVPSSHEDQIPRG